MEHYGTLWHSSCKAFIDIQTVHKWEDKADFSVNALLKRNNSKVFILISKYGELN